MLLVHGSFPSFIPSVPAAGWGVKSLVKIKLLVFLSIKARSLPLTVRVP